MSRKKERQPAQTVRWDVLVCRARRGQPAGAEEARGEKRSSGGEQGWAMLCRVEGAHLWGEGGKLGGGGRGLNTETNRLTFPQPFYPFSQSGRPWLALIFFEKAADFMLSSP